ncbi:MAG TPA: DUF1579 family protein [Roseiflexaceae bacterium]|nr:DUF1579 family protein [Roseiflexaceae bacterium]
MSIPEALRAAAGSWTGEKHLYLPGDPTRTVPSTARVGTAAQGRFCTIAYSWSFEGQPQDGLLLIGQNGDPAVAAVTWIDSWHMGDQPMLCQGPAGESGPLTVRGTYTVEQSPDWGWRIDLEAGADGLRIVMYNVSPEGQEYLGVEAFYRRAPGEGAA